MAAVALGWMKLTVKPLAMLKFAQFTIAFEVDWVTFKVEPLTAAAAAPYCKND
jgi:hypothetical protein